jgi:hypothetical protein
MKSLFGCEDDVSLQCVILWVLKFVVAKVTLIVPYKSSQQLRKYKHGVTFLVQFLAAL